MTFEEILTAAVTERETKNTTEVADATSRRNSLLAFFRDFYPFLQLVNNYFLRGLPFISGDKTINQIKNNLENQITKIETDGSVIEEKIKVNGSLEIKIKKDLFLAIRFINDVNRGNFVRIQLKTNISTFSEEFANQEEAATHLAKIIVKYKD